MNYVSAKEVAALWGISERRVQKLCEDDRIKGVQRLGKSWAIPKGIEKPPDARRKCCGLKNNTNKQV